MSNELIQIVDKIKYFYWQHWPYDWRPGQMWYRLKCFLWHRYTTIRPRYLDHTWYDRSGLMPHMMFEILSQFIEKECSPSIVEWYGEWGAKITVGGEEKYVRDEMQELYDWWHTVWNKEVEEVKNILWAEALKHTSNQDIWEQRFATSEGEAIYKRCVRGCNKLERTMDVALEARLHRLINIIPHLWT